MGNTSISLIIANSKTKRFIDRLRVGRIVKFEISNSNRTPVVGDDVIRDVNNNQKSCFDSVRSLMVGRGEGRIDNGNWTCFVENVVRRIYRSDINRGSLAFGSRILKKKIFFVEPGFSGVGSATM